MFSLFTFEVFFTVPLYRTLCIANWHRTSVFALSLSIFYKSNEPFILLYLHFLLRKNKSHWFHSNIMWNTIYTRSDAHSLIAVNEVSGLLQSTNASDDGIWKRCSFNLVLLFFVLSHSCAFKVWVFLIRPRWVAAGGVIDFLV